MFPVHNLTYPQVPHGPVSSLRVISVIFSRDEVVVDGDLVRFDGVSSL
jgi:hypothetical protein